MAMTKEEALKMAIEFMGTLTIDVGIKTWNEKRRKEAIQACKEALEQPALDWMIKEKKLEHLKEQPAQEPYIEPTYYVKHPDGTYSEAIPQPSRY